HEQRRLLRGRYICPVPEPSIGARKSGGASRQVPKRRINRLTNDHQLVLDREPVRWLSRIFLDPGKCVEPRISGRPRREHYCVVASRSAMSIWSRSAGVISSSAERKKERSGRSIARLCARTSMVFGEIDRPKALVIRRRLALTLTAPVNPNSCACA